MMKCHNCIFAYERNKKLRCFWYGDLRRKCKSYTPIEQ